MSNEPIKSTQAVPLHDSFNGASNLQLAIESYNGAANLQKSFNGASNLQCQPIASTAAPVTSTPITAAPSTSQNQISDGK
ncbi:MAG: hypothetical protein ACRCU9_06815 [Iodobacter sp.]